MLDGIEIGRRVEIGRFTFTAEAIKEFAGKYDPQAFHLDEEAARVGPFGRLAASGWHTAALWMRLRVEHGVKEMAERAAAGRPPWTLGPSPGFSNLVWPRPVYAGDTVTFYTEPTGVKPLTSRPGWFLLFARNTGDNQHGELVYSFDGAVFIGL